MALDFSQGGTLVDDEVLDFSTDGTLVQDQPSLAEGSSFLGRVADTATGMLGTVFRATTGINPEKYLDHKKPEPVQIDESKLPAMRERMRLFNPRATDEQIDALARMELAKPAGKPYTVDDRATDLEKRGMSKADAAINAAFNDDLEQRFNEKHRKAAADPLTGARISESFRPERDTQNTQEEMDAARDKIGLNRLHDWANDHPLKASTLSGLASLTTMANAPQAAINLVGEHLMGDQFTPVPKWGFTDDVKRTLAAATPDVAQKSLGDSYRDGDLTMNLAANTLANGPSMVLSAAGAVLPALRPFVLPLMGTMSTGQNYSQGDSAGAAVLKGGIEVATEFIPFKTLDALLGKINDLPLPAKNEIGKVAALKLAKVGGLVTTQALSNAVEESAAQVLGNAVDIGIQGKDGVGLLDGVDKAAAVGAISSKLMTFPHAASILAAPGSRQAMAERELSAAMSQDLNPDVQDVVDFANRNYTTSDSIRPEATALQTPESKLAALRAEREKLMDMRRAAAPTPETTAATITSPDVSNVDEAIAAAQASTNTTKPIDDALRAVDAESASAAASLDAAIRSGIPGVDQSDLLGRVAREIGAADAPAAVPATSWTGRHGDGYPTIEQAQAGLRNISKFNPSYTFQIEPLPNGKFRVAGYVKQSDTTAGVPDDGGSIPFGGVNGQPDATRGTQGNTGAASRLAGSGATQADVGRVPGTASADADGKPQRFPALTGQQVANTVPASTDATGKPASWVIRKKDTGEVQFETFNPAVVAKINTAKYEAIPVGQHLSSLNSSVPSSTKSSGQNATPSVVLQNRDRTSAASIAQMNEIAAKPDYMRVGPSREMQSGSPVVFGDMPKTAVVGRTETVVDGKGDRVQTRYAVVEATDLLASNRADGTTVAEYADGVLGKLRAVAGNGRTAGLQAAYERGTADQYRNELQADAQAVGINPQAIAGMKAPVLVRVMDAADVKPDMGDRTNIAGTQELSPVEQATNDSRRINIAALRFDDNGDPTADTLRGFIFRTPVSERGRMQNPDGTPTRQAVDRLMAATFKQAYGSDELVQLYAQATDPEARAVMSAMADAAGAMATLSDAGDLDIRQVAADAAKMAVNASRQGLKLADVLKNADLDMNPEAFVVAKFFADNIRSAKRMGDGLRAWAQFAAEQAQTARDNQTQSGFFGDQPTITREQLIQLIGQGTSRFGQSTANSARLADVDGYSERQAADRGAEATGSADSSAVEREAEGLTSPTQSEVLANQDRAAQADKLDERAQVKRESEAGAGLFQLQMQDGRQDTTGGLFDTPAEPVAKQTPDKTSIPAKPIEDAGEKIGGARKDRWKERGMDLSDLDAMSESEGAELVNKANVWKPDYEAMAEESEPVTAAMVKTIYDRLAAKPTKNTPEGRRQYVQMMRIVRDVFTEAKGPQAVQNAYNEIRLRAGVNTMDPQAKQAARTLLFSVYKGRSDPFVLGYSELSKAKKMVEDGFPGKTEPWRTRLVVGRMQGGEGTTERGVEIYTKESQELGTPLTREKILAGFFRVLDKKNKAVAYAATKADAEAAAKTIYERDFKGSKDGKPEPERPHLDELKRENLPQRIDRDVTAEDFIKTFGFRGVEFGNWSAQDERQRIINMAYDGLMDLAEIIGLPPKAMSLNGTLGMAFGARGTGRALAHYEPGKLVINMTKLRGGGSLAHEWAHALDHYFGELDKPDAYTTQARGASGWTTEDQYNGIARRRMEMIDGKWKSVEKVRLDNLRPEMAKAFDAVMRALFQKQITKAEMVRSQELDLERTEALAQKETDTDMKAMYQRMAVNKRQVLDELRQDPEDTLYTGRGRTAYAEDAQALSGKSTKGYWVRPTEMFARAFESWVFDRVTAMGAKSDYLVHGVEEDRFAGGGYKGNPYPTGEERARINSAFETLVGEFKTKETSEGLAIYSTSDRSVPLAAGNWIDVAVIAKEVENRIGQFAHQPPIRIRSSAVGVMPGATEADAVAGAVHDGAIYLFRDQLATVTEVQRTLFHELLHYGLRKVYSRDKFIQEMRKLYERDSWIKGRADAWAASKQGRKAAEYGGEEYAIARGVDETLAILAEPNAGIYTRTDLASRVVVRVSRWLADLAETWGFKSMAAKLRGMKNPEARALIQQVFRRLETDANPEHAGWFDDAEPAFRQGNLLASSFNITDETKAQLFQRKVQDHFNRVKVVQDLLREQGGSIDEASDVYRAEERMHGIVQEKMVDLRDQVLQPLMEITADSGIELDELALYAYAKHAKERNAYIQGLRTDMPDNGSGMTDTEAQDILDAVAQSGKQAEYDAAHQMLLDINRMRQDLQLQAGLITQDEYDAWRSQYQHYVPLRGFEAVNDEGKVSERGKGTGRKFNIRGKETMRALGRQSRASDIIENIITDYQTAVVRAEKNSVLQRFLKLVMDNPDPDLWEIDAVRTRAAMNRATGQVESTFVVDKGPDTVGLKVAGREVYLKIHDDLLARALRGPEDTSMNQAARVVTNVTGHYLNLLRNTITRWNPEFALTNMERDLGMALPAVIDELGEKGGVLFAKYYPGATAASAASLLGKLNKMGPEWQRYFTEYRESGGTTGGFYVKDAADLQMDLRMMMVAAGAKPKTAYERIVQGSSKIGLRHAAKALEFLGSTSEHAARVAAFRAAREMGKSPAESAAIAKNLTTNFNRKGEWGGLLNSLYLFANANIQGNARLFKMLKNPKMVKYFAGMTGAMAALAMFNAAVGGDDDDDEPYWDKIPQYIKERSIVIMLPPGLEMDGAEKVGKKGRYITIAAPFGLNTFSNLGYELADVYRHAKNPMHGHSAGRAAWNMTSGVVAAVNPFGGSMQSSEEALLAVLPTIFDLPAQFIMGVDAFGRPTSPPVFNEGAVVDSENVNVRQSGGPAHMLARWINKITGGDEETSGLVDVAPGSIENAARTVGGGAGKFIYDSIALAGDAFDEDPEFFVRDIPFVRRAYGEVGADVDQGLYYERRQQIKEAKAEVDRKQDAGKDMTDAKKLALYSMADKAKEISDDLSSNRREMIDAKKDPDTSAAYKKARLRELKRERDKLTTDFNMRWRATMQAYEEGSFNQE